MVIEEANQLGPGSIIKSKNDNWLGKGDKRIITNCKVESNNLRWSENSDIRHLPHSWRLDDIEIVKLVPKIIHCEIW
jgi:hypothetical protein